MPYAVSMMFAKLTLTCLVVALHTRLVTERHSIVSRTAIKLGRVSLPATPHDETPAPSRVITSRLCFPSLSSPFSSAHHSSIQNHQLINFDSRPWPSIRNDEPRDSEEEQNAPQSPRPPRYQCIHRPCRTVLPPCRRRLHYFLPYTHRTLPRANPLSIRPACPTVHARNVLESVSARDLSWEEDLGVRYGMLVL
jgi:hypothetical protein